MTEYIYLKDIDNGDDKEDEKDENGHEKAKFKKREEKTQKTTTIMRTSITKRKEWINDRSAYAEFRDRKIVDHKVNTSKRHLFVKAGEPLYLWDGTGTKPTTTHAYNCEIYHVVGFCCITERRNFQSRILLIKPKTADQYNSINTFMSIVLDRCSNLDQGSRCSTL